MGGFKTSEYQPFRGSVRIRLSKEEGSIDDNKSLKAAK
jgi:hypothetical protein